VFYWIVIQTKINLPFGEAGSTLAMVERPFQPL
jgi:hypothetical protein